MKTSASTIIYLGLMALIASPILGQTGVPDTSLQPDVKVETIVAIRHGEKPPGGLGNLNVRGLNRALALPKVLFSKFGKPAFIFAPNPTEKVDDSKYYYVRPIVTIDPTAILCQLPVNTAFGCSQVNQLAEELRKPEYGNAIIYMAWEHAYLDYFARQVVKSYGGDPGQVPPWPGDDFDTIFIFTITHDHGKDTLAFHIDHEGLNNLSDIYPQ